MDYFTWGTFKNYEGIKMLSEWFFLWLKPGSFNLKRRKCTTAKLSAPLNLSTLTWWHQEAGPADYAYRGTVQAHATCPIPDWANKLKNRRNTCPLVEERPLAVHDGGDRPYFTEGSIPAWALFAAAHALNTSLLKRKRQNS